MFLSVGRKCFPLNVQHLHIKQFVEVTQDHQSPCLLIFARRCLDTILLLYAKKNIKLLHFSCTRSRFRTVLLITDYCAVFSKQASKDIKSQIEWACFTKHLSNWLNHAALETCFSVQQQRRILKWKWPPCCFCTVNTDAEGLHQTVNKAALIKSAPRSCSSSIKSPIMFYFHLTVLFGWNTILFVKSQN